MVAIEVLSLTRQHDVTSTDLAAVIEKDPALTAKILKVVNSPLYGVQKQVTTLKRAMNMMGLRSVRVLALSFSLAEGLRGNRDDNFDHQWYWRQSLTMAVTCHLLAKITAAEQAEEAFIIGLLSNIGLLGCHRVAPEKVRTISEAYARHDADLCQFEQEVLGATHAQIGCALLSNWGLPDSLCQAVGAHLGEGIDKLEGPVRQLASIAQAAATVTDLFHHNLDLVQLESAKQSICDQTGVDEQQFELILEELHDHVKQMVAVLSIPIGQTLSYAQIKAQAASQLADLSMEDELERTATARQATDAQHQVNRLEKEKQSIIQTASTDGLTALANRAAFDRYLAEQLQQAASKRTSVGLILLDVDHFKKLNDTHGYQAGDQVLRRVGATLKTVGRKVGFSAHYRVGQFAIVVPNRPPALLGAMAELVRRHIEATPVEHKCQSQQGQIVTTQQDPGSHGFGEACGRLERAGRAG